MVEFPYFSISFKHLTVNDHPRIRNPPCILTSSIFDPPIHPLLPLSSPCPCCLSRCLIFQPPQLVKLLKELTLPSSTDLKCSVTYNIISLYRTTPFDSRFPHNFKVRYSTERFKENLIQDLQIKTCSLIQSTLYTGINSFRDSFFDLSCYLLTYLGLCLQAARQRNWFHPGASSNGHGASSNT